MSRLAITLRAIPEFPWRIKPIPTPCLKRMRSISPGYEASQCSITACGSKKRGSPDRRSLSCNRLGMASSRLR